MKHLITWFVLLCFASFASCAQAATDWFVLFDANGSASSNSNHPAAKKIAELAADKHELKCIAFAPNGGWVIFWDRSQYEAHDIPAEAIAKMEEVKTAGQALGSIAFTPTGGWALFWNRNDWKCSPGVPKAAVDKIAEVAGGGHLLRSISFSHAGGWVLLVNEAGIWHTGLADDVADRLNEAISLRIAIRCVAFSNLGDWFMTDGHAFRASNGGLPLSMKIAELCNDGRVLRSIAVVPQDPATARYWLDTRRAQRVAATLTTDIDRSDEKVDEWCVGIAKVPGTPGQVIAKSTFTPAGNVIADESPLRRPYILAHITDGRTRIHSVLSIDATLMSRRLRELPPGQEPPKVADLSAAEVEAYTRSSDWADLSSKPFTDFLAAAGLKRLTAESDMAYAHRAFAAIKHGFVYEYPTPNDTAAKACSALKSDCAGLSYLFASLMRVSGIPARICAGRMAVSQKPGDTTGDYKKNHVRAEFFARGIGWVPVDCSAAVCDTAGDDFACFGNDAGDFIALADDHDFVIDTIIAGKQHLTSNQHVQYWWRGTGSEATTKFNDLWTVKKQ
jgi:hypothetical protein